MTDQQRSVAAYDVDVVAVARVTAAQAEEISRAHYGISGSAHRLAAEHDDVFRVVAGDGSSRLLRVGAADHGGQAGGVSLQAAILLHLASAAPGLPVQRVIASLDGRPEVTLPPEETPRLARMTSWLDGDLLGRETADQGLRADIGATLARLSVALRGFSHPAARRTHWWDLQQLGRLRPLLGGLPPGGVLPEVREALGAAGDGLGAAGGLDRELAGYLDRFDAVVRPRLARVPVQVIHTDFHGLNLLGDGKRVTGILDFGDALAGPVAMDVAVAACYQLGPGADPLAPALDVVAGYHAVDPLGDADLELAAEFIVARVVARIIVSQWNALREPANRGYLLRRTPQAIEHYSALRRVGADEIATRLRAVCQ
jgi:Ser/Thr protein kinase RdoA (MazF antagonist)